ncbi:MAG: hypothetical protein WAT92_01275 [Saprospiraceae bacterium]
MNALSDFKFLIGKWSVHNRRLKKRLDKCDEWVSFDATMETKSILNGLGIMDEMKTSFFGDEFIGLSIRMFDPASNTWQIYWADTANPSVGLKEQVVGQFADGVGLFYGKEMYDGQEVKLRFMWKSDSFGTAEWQQAYWDESIGDWETNWTMFFSSMRVQ